MLVLSRRTNETVVIQLPSGERIIVMNIEVRGDKARLGFDAPKDCVIHRSEVLQAIEVEAAGTQPAA